MSTRVLTNGPDVRVAIRALRLALTGIGLYALFALVTALLTRQPYYQSFLVACMGMALALTVAMRALGPPAGVTAGILVVLVHFGWRGWGSC